MSEKLSESWKNKPPSEYNSDERYFATKAAMMELSGNALKTRLSEIYTPDVLVQMNEIERKYLSPEKKEELRLELNRDHAKKRRDKDRQKKYGKRSTRKV